MAFEREVFPILETAGKRGLTAFGFRDSSGNLILPQLTAAGKIAVDTGAAPGTCLNAFGKNATGSLTEVVVATIALQNSKMYSAIASTVSCTRTAVYRLVWNNNGVETELAVQIVGAGQFSHDFVQDCLQFTSGATGTQELKVFAYNLDKVSQLSATISCLEAA
jgi:hypothetical protein